jgi:hypothetical protein
MRNVSLRHVRTRSPLGRFRGVTWVRLDDGFTQHPKVAAAGPLAIAMQVAALCYCNKNLTDGFIPRAVARTLLDWELDNDDAYWTITVKTDDGRSEDLTPEFVWDCLLSAGLWDRVPGGFRIHDYLEYQPSKDEVLALREVRAEAGRIGGLKRAENQANQANAKQSASKSLSKIQANAKQNSSPYPVPVPVSPENVSKPTVSHPPAGGRYTDEFEGFWRPYPATNGSKADAFKAWKQLSAEDRAAAVGALPAWLACDRWREGYVKHAGAWLRGRMWEVSPAAARASPSNGSQPEQKRPSVPRFDDIRHRYEKGGGG